MASTFEQRMRYLKALESAGGEVAFQEGLKVLQRIDKGGYDPREALMKDEKTFKATSEMAATLSGIQFPKDLGKLPWTCMLKCLPLIIAQNWPALALCAATCFIPDQS
jgi:hypothetical protein